MKTTRSLLCCLLLLWSTIGRGDDRKDAPRPRIEVCFVLDTTGSMSDLIEGAQAKIWSIANELITATPTPELKLALVGYRDRGDHYVTRLTDLTADIDTVHATLMGFTAIGGGDGPESVNQALHEAVTKVSWSDDREVLKIVFLVGDAPPHMDYEQDVRYPEVCRAAVARNLVINAVQCGQQEDTAAIWKEIAKLAEGKYIPLVQSGGMVQIAAPQDEEIAALNRAIGGTLIGYGRAETRRGVAAKQAAAEAAAPAAAADRLSYNAATGSVVQGGGELIDAIERGDVRLEEVEAADLPEELRGLDARQLAAAVYAKRATRKDIQARLERLLSARQAFLAAERRRLTEAGQGDSFDEEVAATVRAQAARQGLTYGD
ncbi:MAG: VWA domain-containing protein [Planctomycetes bacterium]|nr:VWA domain-containing protein [Planctomycetota bacterium]